MPTAILQAQTSQTTYGKYGQETTNGAHKVNGNVSHLKDTSRSPATSTPSISASLGSINAVLVSSFLEQYSEAHEYMYAPWLPFSD